VNPSDGRNSTVALGGNADEALNVPDIVSTLDIVNESVASNPDDTSQIALPKKSLLANSRLGTKARILGKGAEAAKTSEVAGNADRAGVELKHNSVEASKAADSDMLAEAGTELP
jgi:ABC-type hemin transport system substrate-binding protein